MAKLFNKMTVLLAFTAVLVFYSDIAFTQEEKEESCETCGKIELAPVYVHVDVLKSGKTTASLDMGGLTASAAYLLFDGWGFCIKPSVLYVQKGNDSLFIGGLSLGHVTPITKKLSLTPGIGISYGDLRSRIDLPHIEAYDLKERFRSISPYLSLDATYRFNSCTRMCLMFQYAICRTHTIIGPFPAEKSNTKGPVYGVMLERDLNKKWSINLGGSYNTSLSHEKHGVRGYGVKLGIVRWF
jgi:hypothetical protein